jgi:hypothetical protein
MRNIFLGILLSIVCMGAHAGTSSMPIMAVPDSVNRAYAGLKWTLNEGIQPEVVVGFRHSRVESGGNTQGGDVSLSMKIFNVFQLGKLRAKYFNGQESVQGEVSGGFDFTKGLFAGFGIKAPHSNFGVDFLPKASNTFEPYFMIDTLKRNDKPNKKINTACPASDPEQCYSTEPAVM